MNKCIEIYPCTIVHTNLPIVCHVSIFKNSYRDISILVNTNFGKYAFFFFLEKKKKLSYIYREVGLSIQNSQICAFT